MTAATRTKSSKLGQCAGEMLAMVVFLLIVGAACFWISQGQQEKFAKDQLAEVTQGVALTAKGCPGARPKIAEIGADGTYSRREIEVLSTVITTEQARTGGLSACRAPSWRWFMGGWVVSKDYAT